MKKKKTRLEFVKGDRRYSSTHS